MTESDPADEEGRRSPAGGAPHPRGRGPNAGRGGERRAAIRDRDDQSVQGRHRELSQRHHRSGAIALANETTDVQILGRRMTAAGLLIQALGGGWSAGGLPSAGDVGGAGAPKSRGSL